MNKCFLFFSWRVTIRTNFTHFPLHQHFRFEKSHRSTYKQIETSVHFERFDLKTSRCDCSNRSYANGKFSIGSVMTSLVGDIRRKVKIELTQKNFHIIFMQTCCSILEYKLVSQLGFVWKCESKSDDWFGAPLVRKRRESSSSDGLSLAFALQLFLIFSMKRKMSCSSTVRPVSFPSLIEEPFSLKECCIYRKKSTENIKQNCNQKNFLDWW